ncbi:hypothetical protein NL676_026348 [Syzygium grande]|nr:hypothetical protein NL676_026348 [Syzygium grande]
MIFFLLSFDYVLFARGMLAELPPVPGQSSHFVSFRRLKEVRSAELGLAGLPSRSAQSVADQLLVGAWMDPVGRRSPRR